MDTTQVKLPNWLEHRHSLLWDSFKDTTFNMEEAVKVLEEKNHDKRDEVPVFLSELRKAGWLKAEIDSNDARKTIYTLKSKEEIIGDLFTVKRGELTRSDIEGLLKKAADLIRTRVDYKFILILLFLKRISDKWELEFEKAYKEALEDGLKDAEAKKEAKNAAYHDFDLPDEFLWDNIRKDVSTLPEKLSQAFKNIAQKNPELKDILENVDFIQFTTSRENAEILRQLIELFSEKKLHHVSPDILGDAYEWILRYFAPQKAKEGEVYTPREVIKLLVEILDPQPGESVYDPASASNGMLIISYKHVEDKKGKVDADKLFLFGQEANPKTLALGRMNLYIHDIKNANVAYGDTLLYPKFKEGDGVKQFNVVIANPPWNQDGYSEETLKKGDFWKQRFNYGFVPGQSADWAWIQHMLASARDGDGGRVGIVIDNGCLFRGGKEQAVRAKALELIECVILLPEKLFYNTGAPGGILIFNKNKPKGRKDKVLFINASQEYEQHPDVRKLNILAEGNVQRIADAYHNWHETEGFSRIVNLEEIQQNDYNLNVTLYVFPEDETEEIDVKKEWTDLKKIEKDVIEVENKIEGFLGEIKFFKDDIIERRLVNLDSVFDVTNGTTPSTKNKQYWDNPTINWITPADLGKLDGKITIEESERKISEIALNEVNLTLMPKQSIVLSTRAPVGYVVVITKESTFNQGCKGLIPKNKEKVNPYYYCYYLSSKTNMLQNKAGQSTFKELSTKLLKQFEVPEIDIIKQNKIAEILLTIDDRIALENKRKGKLETIKKGLMNDLLTGKKKVKLAR